MTTIRIPNNWAPRPYQQKAWNYLERGGKHLEVIAHRRWGKDDVCLNFAATQMIERPATYWHMLPQSNQVRKAIWEAVNPHTGRRRIDESFPSEVFHKRESDMLIRCKYNDATWQALGSDNFQSFIGSPPAGIVYSEWPQANPSARGYLRPILTENNGYQIYIGTPRGRNHGYKTFKSAMNTQGSMAILQTIEDTGVLDADQLKIELAEYVATYGKNIGTALYQQEYFCSFDAAILGSVWGDELTQLEKEGRVCDVPHQPELPVFTAWDIGRTDATAIWFFQVVAGEIHIIDYLCETLKDPDYFCSQMLGVKVDINIEYGDVIVRHGADVEGAEHRKAYDYQTIWVPHDAKAKTFAAKGKSVYEQLATVFGWSKIRKVPGLSIIDGLQAARKTLPRCYFDIKCDDGVEAIKQYQYMWDDTNKKFNDKPNHDWTSNPADAFRYLSIVWEESKPSADESKPRFKVERTIDQIIAAQTKKRLSRYED